MPPHHQPIKFLLVDDLEANLIALEGLLKREGLELLKAKSGREALELLLAHDVTLAFVDVQMPEMSGFELAEIMRSTGRTRGTPIIFLTAGTVDHDRKIRGYETGAIDFLPKPIDPSILLNKAAVFFDLAVQRRSLEESERRLQEANDKLEWSNSELERADRSKDEFLAMLAHELRNPLAPILTGIDILMQSPGDAAATERIGHMMKRQIGQMSHLIDDLLDVSRITKGKIVLQKTTVTLTEVAAQAIESVRPLIDARKHDLRFEIADDTWSVPADHQRLAQIIANLLSNAAKYTPEGGHILLSVTAGDAGAVEIAVKDNGEGISPEDQTRIFDLFDQGSSSRRDGLGIGLTLVKSLVELHGGAISVASAGTGMGSTFTVRLHGLDRLPAASSFSAPENDGGDGPGIGRLRVLIADDGKATADVLGMFFDLEGMETRVVYDGMDAISAAEEFRPDLACLDLGMPRADGFEAAARIRELCPEAYIVALSGWGSARDREKSAGAGFDEHLVKPVSPEELRSLLGRLAAPRATGTC